MTMTTTIDRVGGSHRDRDGSTWGVYEAVIADDGFHGITTGRALKVTGSGDSGHAAAINAAMDMGDYLPPTE